MVLPAKPQIPERRIFIPTGAFSFAAGFDRGNPGEISRQIISGKIFDVHFDEADEGTAKIGPFPAAAVDDDGDGDDPAAMGADDVDGFLDPSTAGHDIFGDNESLVRSNLESPAQDQAAARVFFRKNVAFPQGSSDFLADDYSTQGGGDDGVTIYVAQFLGEASANIGCNPWVLQDEGTLKELAAMQTGPQDKVPVEQRARLTKYGQQIVAHENSGEN